MTIRGKIINCGDKCTLEDCEPGFFIWDNNLCLKSEYMDNDAYNLAGEYFWGGVATREERRQIIVQPVVFKSSDKTRIRKRNK